MKQSLPKLEVFCDATWKRGVAVIGYASQFLEVSGTAVIKADNINTAEIAAVELAMKALGLKYDLSFATDSESAVRHYTTLAFNIRHVPREANVANALVRARHELFHQPKQHK